MQRIINKQVLALYPGGGLLQDDYFNRIREKMFNSSPYSTNEPNGIERKKKTVIYTPGLGSEDRGHNPGAGIGLGRDENESQNKSVSSGYNDGEQANDETGPGFTPISPNPYFTSTWDNELFSDLELKGQGRDSARKHYKGILDSVPVIKPSRKFPVD